MADLGLSQRCAVPACEVTIPRADAAFCPRHWGRIPMPLRVQVFEAWDSLATLAAIASSDEVQQSDQQTRWHQAIREAAAAAIKKPAEDSAT